MKRTGVEKNTNPNMNNNEDRNGETSISTSSSMEMSQEQALTTDNKTEEGNGTKKMKRGESSNSNMETCAGQEEESIVEETTISDLPPEMLAKILQCVDTPSLFNCRLVTRNWRTIASGILRNRSNNFNDFEYEHGRLLWTHSLFDQNEERSLRDFVRCIKNSKDCPFSQFYFCMTDSDDPLQFFKEKDCKDFTSYFASPNKKIKCLWLSFHYLDDLQTFQMFTQNMSELLLNKIPQLEELTLDIYDSLKAPEVKLFSTLPNPDQVSIPVPLQVQVQLPNLKVLRFESQTILFHTEIFKDLLRAAVNLKCLRMRITGPEDFILLHSLGKLHLLKETTIILDTDFVSESDKNSAPLPLPKLKILDLRLSMYESSSVSRSQANFLGNLFESSKDTLTELKTQPFGFLPGLQLPTFKTLGQLKLTHYEIFPQPIFPPGIRSRDVFPVVSELNLEIYSWESAFPQEDSIPLLPRVKILRMNDFKLKEDAISILALMCPNLEKLKIHKDNECCHDSPTLNLLNFGQAIWTHMTKLESLEVDVDLDLSVNNSTALDSCLTGISVENCERLVEMMEAKRKLESYGVSVEIPESKLQALAKREFPSILDMKNLKTLAINPYSGKTLLKRMDFFSKLTWIGEEFAFEFLPHLKPKPEEEETD